jgi:hypothetical protein
MRHLSGKGDALQLLRPIWLDAATGFEGRVQRMQDHHPDATKSFADRYSQDFDASQDPRGRD